MRPSDHVLHSIWNDPGDMRNSRYNIRRKSYYNIPASKFFTQEVKSHSNLDILYHIYPSFRKIENAIPSASSVTTNHDWPMMRLAETYLLPAEAYLLAGEKQKPRMISTSSAHVRVLRQ